MRNLFKLHVREICVRQIRVNQGVDVNATKSYAKKSMDRQMPNKMFFSCRFCINYCIFLEIKKDKKNFLAECTEDIEGTWKSSIYLSFFGHAPQNCLPYFL